MVVLGRVDWILRQLKMGRRGFLSVGEALDRDRLKVKVTLLPACDGQISEVMFFSLTAQLMSVRSWVLSNIAVDKGHRHSSGRSDISIWIKQKHGGTAYTSSPSYPPPPPPPPAVAGSWEGNAGIEIGNAGGQPATKRVRFNEQSSGHSYSARVLQGSAECARPLPPELGEIAVNTLSQVIHQSEEKLTPHATRIRENVRNIQDMFANFSGMSAEQRHGLLIVMNKQREEIDSMRELSESACEQMSGLMLKAPSAAAEHVFICFRDKWDKIWADCHNSLSPVV